MDPKDLSISSQEADREFFFRRKAGVEKTNLDVGVTSDFQDNVATVGKLPPVASMGQVSSVQQRQS